MRRSKGQYKMIIRSISSYIPFNHLARFTLKITNQDNSIITLESENSLIWNFQDYESGLPNKTLNVALAGTGC